MFGVSLIDGKVDFNVVVIFCDWICIVIELVKNLRFKEDFLSLEVVFIVIRK